MATVRVSVNDALIRMIQTTVKDNTCYRVLQDVRTDVDKSQTVPFLTGTLDDRAHNFDAIREGEKTWELHYSAPYAIRRYYEPAIFTTQYHVNATDHWLDAYKEGGIKHEWTLEDAQKIFNEEIRRIAGK